MQAQFWLRNLPRCAGRFGIATAILLAIGAAPAVGQEVKVEASPPGPPGLPTGIDWVFNFKATVGAFGFNNSLYTNPRPDEPSGDLSDNWLEGSIKGALGGTYTTASSAQIYGKLSAVGERTFSAPPPLVGGEASSFGVEDAYLGWRSGNSLGDLGENALDFTVGRAPYTLGHGMLLWDGSSEGGSRGGYWTGARSAFEFAAIGRFKPGSHTLEAFYLDKDDLNENETGTRLSGANYEITGKRSTLGATYMKFFSDADVKPGRDGLNVFNVRADSAPIPKAPDLSFQFEYAAERNGDALDSNAWTLQGAYELSAVSWKPKFSYRYASFQGDNPSTTANEAFDPLLLGFSDWGSWWQGEIAGEYFLSNSNLISRQIRAHVTPSDKVGGGLIFYDFRLDHPEAFGPAITDDHVAFEGDLYIDWKLTRNLLMSVVAAFADPGAAVERLTGRSKNFNYGMVYLAYSY